MIENQQPGTSQWLIPWGSAATDAGGQIKGYASAVSVNKGETITFNVSTNPAQTYTIDIYRIGWYQGLGGRLMQHIGPLSGTPQPACPTDATTGMIECAWAPAYVLTTQTSWTSGIYLALLKNAAGYQNYILFVVRDDGRVAPLLYQQPVLTYQAYNDYPYNGTTGKSLYAFNSYGANTVTGGRNAAKVSFNRPYMGDGTSRDWGNSVFTWEIAFVRWMEKSGYDVTYSTDIDTHTNSGRLLNYNGILSVGHDEYWSREMYDAFVAARDAGVNLAFFGANAADWQVRLEPSSTGEPNRTLVCYRNATIDPNTNPALKTVEWRDPLLGRPEQTLVGVQFTHQVQWRPQYDGNAPYVVTNSGNWVYAGTGFNDGDSVPGLVGYEVDRSYTQYPLPNAVSGTYTLLSQSPFTANIGTSDYSNSSVYQAPSGAWVFAAGVMSWSYGLDGFNGYNVVDPRIQQTTANVLNRFINPATNFTIAASPVSRTVLQGGSTSYDVTITPTNGFSGQVTLSVSGLPGGASGTFAPNPATASSTLSVTTSTSTPAGTYTLTIIAVSGTLTHTTTVSLVVNALPDFTLSASPSSRTVTQGGSTNYGVTINATGGFSGQVSLSVSGLPSGASGSFTPNPATAASTLSVTIGTSTPTGTYTLTLTGVSGTLTHTTTVSLTVTSAAVVYDNSVSSGIRFGVATVTTPSLIIGSGTNRAAMIMVTMSANGATNITASLGGVSGTLIPGTDSGTTASIRTMIFQVINPPSGSQTATVAWTGGTLNADVGVITVRGADQTTPCTNGTFAASNSSPSPTTSVTIASNPGDLTASVAYTADAWVSPFTNQTLKWGVDSSVAGGDIGPGTGTTTHTWTDPYGFQTHAVSGANFSSGAPDFALTASPSSRTVTQGASTSYGVTITPANGFGDQVSLSVSGLPSGASGSFTPNPATAASTLSVTIGTSTPTGTYTLTLTGVSGTLTHTTTVSLIVTSAGVTYDNSVSSGIRFGVATVTTPSLIIGSGTNRAAMIMVTMNANGATNITASLGGVSGTLIPGTDSGTTASIRTMIFQVINPPSGSQTATVAWTGGTLNADVGVITVRGADQATPCTNGTFAAATSSPSPTTSVTITSNPGDLTASVGYTADAWVTPFTNQTLKWGVDSSAAGGDIGPGTGTTTHTWTDPYAFQAHAVSGANFKASATP